MKSDRKRVTKNKVIYSTIRANSGIDDQREERDQQRNIVAIVGPTAVGKSSLAVLLAKKHNGEVISADSRQVYIGLDIGTGKITKKEMGGIPHHLLDVADPKKQYSVSKYQKLARKELDAIFSRKKLPIVVGGTGLYIQAIVNDIAFPDVPPNKTLRKELEKKTTDQLFSMLKKLDAERAKTIDVLNPRRLMRAIEIATALGKVPPYQNTPREDINALCIGLTLPPNDVKKRIAIRLFARLPAEAPARAVSAAGGLAQVGMPKDMIEEVRRLHRRGLSWKRMEELGLEYRYISRYLRKLLSKEEMIEKLRSEIWKYAKRQMTWFKRDTRIKWFDPSEKQAIEKTVREFL